MTIASSDASAQPARVPTPGEATGRLTASGEVTGVEFVGGASVEHGDAGGEERAQRLGAEPVRLRECLGLVALIERHDPIDVGRPGGQAAGQLSHELRLAQVQQRVVAALEADRGAGLSAQVVPAAQRTADVGRPHLHLIADPGELAQRGVQSMGSVSGLVGEIGAGDVTDEQRVAGEQQPRLVASREIADREGQVLGAMTRTWRRRRILKSPTTISSPAVYAVGILAVGIGPAGAGAGRRCKSQTARDVVGVIMGVENLDDLQILVAG